MTTPHPFTFNVGGTRARTRADDPAPGPFDERRLAEVARRYGIQIVGRQAE